MITTFEPPAAISREETIALSNAVLAMPSAQVEVREDIFRIPVLGLEWDDDEIRSNQGSARAEVEVGRAVDQRQVKVVADLGQELGNRLAAWGGCRGSRIED